MGRVWTGTETIRVPSRGAHPAQVGPEMSIPTFWFNFGAHVEYGLRERDSVTSTAVPFGRRIADGARHLRVSRLDSVTNPVFIGEVSLFI